MVEFGQRYVIVRYVMVWYGTVWWHDRPRVSVWWSSEWGEAGESAAPSRAPVPPPRSPPRDAQSTPVCPQRDIVIEIGLRENNIVKESKSGECDLGWVEREESGSE